MENGGTFASYGVDEEERKKRGKGSEPSRFGDTPQALETANGDLLMARPARLERATNRFEVCDSIHLSYGRAFLLFFSYIEQHN